MKSVGVAAIALLSAVVNGVQVPGYVNFTTVTGYFQQDDPATNASTFNYTASNFGLIDREYEATEGLKAQLTQWQKFQRQVEALNAAADVNTVYKVLFLGRHGEGFHNAAESFYGTPAWNCYWSLLNGNGSVSWADADLTAKGIAQAQIANNFWRRQLSEQRMPHPQTYYTSPLTRCLRTANITFSDLTLPDYYPFVPTVKEFFREGISLHTCDRRRSKTYIRNLFPRYQFEAGFKEEDAYWNGVTGEPSAAQDVRSKRTLDTVFRRDDHTWISITSHSGEIGSILRVLGHRSFSLSTGAVIPVLVKAQFVPKGPSTKEVAFTTSTHCASPPITSSAGTPNGCVCTNNAAVTTPLIDVSATPTSSVVATSTPTTSASA